MLRTSSASSGRASRTVLAIIGAHAVNLVESVRDIDLKTLRLVEKMTCAKAAWKQPVSFSSHRIAVGVTRQYVKR
jgi:hypothetical protein